MRRKEREMLEVLPKVARLQASYALGKPLALPMQNTLPVGTIVGNQYLIQEVLSKGSHSAV